MSTYQLTITLESDVLIGTGKGFGAVIDSDGTYDDMGIPFIPAKRIKGLLRDAMGEYLELQSQNEGGKTIESIFGTVGGQYPGKLIVPTLYPVNYDNMKKSFAYAFDHKMATAESVKKLFTTVRTQTTIENEIAKEGSLRTQRVIKSANPFSKGEKLKFVGEFEAGDLSDAEIELLKKAAKWCRNIGSNRTRGLGFVCCQIDKIESKQTKSLPNFNPFSDDQMVRLNYTLRLKKPLIITSPQSDANTVSSYPYITGNNMLGLFASHYLKKNNLARQAHENDHFRSLFLSGQVIFSHAYPKVNNETYQVAPLIYQQEKGNENDLFNLWHPEKTKLKTRSLSSFVSLEKSNFKKYSVEKEIQSHHERDYLTGSPKESVLYSYESIRSGQDFYGSIVGPKKLLELLPLEQHVLIGRSRSSEYGLAAFSVESITEYKPELPENEELTVTVYLQSDALILNEFGFSSSNLADIKRAFDLKDHHKITKSVFTTTIHESFVGVWQMKRPSEVSIKAGSTFLISGFGSSEELKTWLEKVLLQGVGIRTHEGYGKVCWLPIAEKQFTLEPKSVSTLNSQPQDYLRWLRPILIEQFYERCAVDAIVQVENISNLAYLTNSFVSRLLLLYQGEHFLDDLEKLSQRETSKKKLTQVYVGNKNLKEFIKEVYESPFANNKLNQFKNSDAPFELIRNDMEPNSKEVSRFYLRTFLYHLRKKINKKKNVGGAN